LRETRAARSASPAGCTAPSLDDGDWGMLCKT
jgi:hypothetical protein